MTTVPSFGAWVQQQRKLLDLTQADLAEQVGCAVVTIKKIEQNARRPSRQLAALLVEHLQIPSPLREQFVTLARDARQTATDQSLQPSSAQNGAHKQPFVQDSFPFVGRQRELAALNQVLDKMLAGAGQIHFVTGEAGRGKTSLLIEFARYAQARRHDLIVAAGSCDAFAGAGDPYLPFRDVLATLTGEVDVRWRQAISAQQWTYLWRLLPQTAQTLADHGADLIDLLLPSAPLLQKLRAHFPHDIGGQRQLAAIAQQRQQQPSNTEQRQIFEQMRSLLQTFTRQAPLLLLLDDLQWADHASLNLLFYLSQRLTNNRILILGAFRASEVTPHSLEDSGVNKPHPLWAVTTELKRRLGEVELDLEQGSWAENRAFVEALLDSETNHLNQHFRDRLFALTQGHPLFTAELLRTMRERGILAHNEAGAWIQTQAFNWDELPTRVEAAIAQRLERLPPSLQRVLQVAAVEGEIFTAEVVAHVLGDEVRTTIQQLGQLLQPQLQVIESQGSQRTATQLLSHYKFRHILFQRYLYHELDVTTRRYWHEAVAGALEALYGDQVASIAPQLARHFEEAQNTQKALAYFLMAGKRAIQLSAHMDAIRHLQQGLMHLATVVPTVERDRQELAFQLLLSTPLVATRDYSDTEVEAAYHRALHLCQRLRQEPSAPILRGLTILSLLRGNYRKAHEWALQLLAVAEHTQEKMYLTEAHYALGANYFWLGDLQNSRRHLETVIRDDDQQQRNEHILLFVQDPFLICQQRLGYTLWHLGYPEQAERTVQAAVAYAEQLAHPFTLAYVYAFTAWFYADCRKLAQAQKYAELAVTYSKENSISYWQLIGEFYRGWGTAAGGDVQTGMATMHNAMQRFQARKLGVGWPFMCALLAETYGKLGQLEDGFAILVDGLESAHRQDERWCIPELYRIQGELLLQARRLGLTPSMHQAPEDCFQQAIATARQLQAKSLELRAATSLSRLWLEQGKTEAAHQLLAGVYDWFTEGFETPDLQVAKSLLKILAQYKIQASRRDG
ncbi:MAG: AAA family ATPase [Caldilineaceae bacterium]